MTLRLVSVSEHTTRALGAAIAADARPGDVIVLSGELGAGKTCLVQGLALALGHTDRVTSPTFLLARRLDTIPPVVHADAWRLDRVGDLLDLGDELLDDDVVTIVEWGDAVSEVLPADRLEVDIVVDGHDADAPRIVTLVGQGTAGARLDAQADVLRTAVEA